jgi:hypothetical protein
MKSIYVLVEAGVNVKSGGRVVFVRFTAEPGRTLRRMGIVRLALGDMFTGNLMITGC